MQFLHFEEGKAVYVYLINNSINNNGFNKKCLIVDGTTVNRELEIDFKPSHHGCSLFR